MLALIEFVLPSTDRRLRSCHKAVTLRQSYRRVDSEPYGPVGLLRDDAPLGVEYLPAAHTAAHVPNLLSLADLIETDLVANPFVEVLFKAQRQICPFLWTDL